MTLREFQRNSLPVSSSRQGFGIATRWILASAFVVSILAVSAPTARADSFSFSALNATAAVPAGSTIGWGYSITNNSLTNWLVTTNVFSDLFLNAAPQSLFDFPILAPGDTATLAFDVANNLGLYSLTWDETAPEGFVNSGSFGLSAEWWDGDPFAGGNFLNTADDQFAAYSALVSPASPSSVPEPASLVLLGTGCGLLLLNRRPRRSSRNRKPAVSEATH